ncbi:MAG: GNAT family N-acetyltransferase [Arthrobacter sp.]|jgi:ElaA protein|nr:GNAT family N-acetyltransferase [Arthrobacter sp.]
MDSAVTLHRSRLAELPATTWHRITTLRQNVFVVEQECAYPDLDERDDEPGAEHLWLQEADGSVLATLRLLHEDGGAARRIGRVATRRDARGRGLMARLLTAGIEACSGRAIEIEAQAHLQGWYERFGFAVSGAEFLEDGIPHVPMVRPAERNPGTR